MPVEDYPSLPDMPAATGTVAERRRSPTPSPRPSPPPAATTCSRCSPASASRSTARTISLLATDRFRLSHRELGWNPRTPDESLAALVPAKVLGDTAKSLTAGSEVTIALSATGSGEGIIGFEGAAAGGVRRTTTRLLDGEFPKVRSLFPSEHQTTARVDKAALIESVKRVALVAERNTAVQLAFSDGVLTLDAGSGDEAQASESIEATIEGEDITTGLQPAVPARRAHRHRRSPWSSSPSPRPPSRSCISGSTATATASTTRLPLPADAAPPAVLTPARTRHQARPHHEGASRMDIGLVGLGKMGGNMRTRLRDAGHTVVGYDRNPDLTDVDEPRGRWSSRCPRPKVVWVMVPGRRPDRARPSRALGELLGEGDLVVDGGNSRGPTTSSTPSCSPRRASASSTAASPAASGA